MLAVPAGRTDNPLRCAARNGPRFWLCREQVYVYVGGKGDIAFLSAFTIMQQD